MIITSETRVQIQPSQQRQIHPLHFSSEGISNPNIKLQPSKYPQNIPKSTLWTRGWCLSQPDRTPHPALYFSLFCIPIEGLGMATHQALPTHHALPFFLVFPHLRNMTAGVGRTALRGQSRLWSYEKGSKVTAMFTAAGVTRSPVILHDYFSPSCEMAGRWILVGCSLLLRDGVCLGEGKWCRANEQEPTQTPQGPLKPQGNSDPRTGHKTCHMFTKEKGNTWVKQHFIWEQISHCFHSTLRLFSMLPPDLKSSNSLMSSSFQCH